MPKDVKTQKISKAVEKSRKMSKNVEIFGNSFESHKSYYKLIEIEK